MTQLIDDKDLNFLLYDVFKLEQLTQLERYQEHDKTTFDSILDTAKGIATDYFAPHNAKADQHEPTFDGKKVETIAEVKTAWNQFADAGLLCAQHDYNAGGMQLPILVNMACNAFFMSANPSTVAYSFLTAAAANVIQAFGSEEQKHTFVPHMFSGRFSGTMALTEPDVGSSLGDLTTKAIPQADGSYRIKGQKMFISGGDQDITENIVHLVLARIQDAPQGVKGISLFIVPKFKTRADGSLDESNDVQLAGLLHKMGYRGTTSTVLSFGENDNCLGYLLGEAGHGLKYMFKMMNEARVGVGLGAAMIGYRGYLESLNYAKNRPQGRPVADKDPNSKPVNIIEHSDVKRMLLTQKSYVEASLALCLFAARLIDEHQAAQDEESAILLDLITPVVKSFPSAYGPKANDLAIQVLGGAGYTREYPIEQCYRDNRLNPIHEGTYGIQSLDLLGRKLWQHNGKGLSLLMQRIQKTLSEIQDHKLAELAETFKKHLATVQKTTQVLGQALHQGRVEVALANSGLYLDMMGKTIIAWLWLEMANQAQLKFASSDYAEDQQFMTGKMQAAQYFIRWELPEVEHQAQLLMNFDDTCLNMQPEWF
ncbi:acyl-CoA dehydrogenase [Acinetobacter schindleri]|jgi:alkylation response protein AidB-like acyl-CoA dehydrogenase|uniref:acyl-CoA dehydrogenase n=1 Tax=Acinetobacter TaxID=469 RepID=UPI0006623A4A|nr:MULTISPECIES: acyl-CoA dehydrogenase [Acinetobacter]KMV00911.1 acyl-CoA dehydrogenase [Acinetobacter sp. VT 511]MBB4836072.1 butyryl-CoA dehydrogenase [Acinetobacter schindleri]PUR00223.1 acyl-CoA dehydrogenase [Acinetobacter schindleri]WBX39336.1 acyl-CoA dehydrogenase [Acinetobacter schindleri]